ncbi:hypothetical protein [Archangium violaceum]
MERPKKPYRRPKVRSVKILLPDLFTPTNCVPSELDPCDGLLPGSSGA